MEIEQILNDFKSENGIGRELQKRLEEKNEKEAPYTSWLVKWWNQENYLFSRASCIMEFTYYLHLANKFNLSQLDFAAQMAF